MAAKYKLTPAGAEGYNIRMKHAIGLLGFDLGDISPSQDAINHGELEIIDAKSKTETKKCLKQ